MKRPRARARCVYVYENACLRVFAKGSLTQTAMADGRSLIFNALNYFFDCARAAEYSATVLKKQFGITDVEIRDY